MGKLVVDGVYIDFESLTEESIVDACKLMYGDDFGDLSSLTEEAIKDAVILMYGEKIK